MGRLTHTCTVPLREERAPAARHRLVRPSFVERIQSQIFTQDFVLRGIEPTPPWQELSDAALDRFVKAPEGIYKELRSDSTINEAQLGQVVIERVLNALRRVSAGQLSV